MENIIRAAKGEIDADIILKNGKIVDVINMKILDFDVVIYNGKIVAIDKPGVYTKSFETIDLKGKYIVPGLIDSHVHIESSLVSPQIFSKISLKNGVTSIITDPHEIANVKGTEGIKYMISEANKSEFDVFFMLPSCVPSTNFENSGAILLNEDLKDLYEDPSVLGLAEFMNFPGVLNLDKDCLDKIKYANSINKIIDGHAPNIDSKSLNAYISTNIKTDHECETVDDMQKRLDRGMHVLIREGTVARNLETLIKNVNVYNNNLISFCTDDKHLDDLVNEGSINFCIKKAIKLNIDPILAIKMATYNAANTYNLNDRGSITPGKIADILIVDDLNKFNIESVMKKGKFITDFSDENLKIESCNLGNSINIPKDIDFNIYLKSDVIRTLKVVPNNLYSEESIDKVVLKNNIFDSENKENIDNLFTKLFVIERHNKDKNFVGKCIVKGLGIKKGAIATTIAHDSHNLIVAGNNDIDIKLAIEEIKRIGGGIVSVVDNKVVSSLQLEIVGLMTSRKIKDVLYDLDSLHHSLNKLEFSGDFNPFLTLSFLSLPVIPKLKLTDQGLFDVEKFEFVDLEV